MFRHSLKVKVKSKKFEVGSGEKKKEIEEGVASNAFIR